MAVTPAGGEGTLDTWRCPCQRGGRLDKTGVTPMLAWTRGRGQNHGRRGVCEPELEPRRRWEGSRKKAKVSNRTTGNPAVRDYRGASGNVAMVEMRSRLAYRKSESGNPPPTAGAPELYPNRRHGGTVNPPCNRKSGNGNPPPKAGRALLLSQRDDGLRPQDDEGLGPAGPNLPQRGPEQPVEGGQRWSRPFALEHSYLLSKGEDFESGVYATFKEYADGS